METSEEQEIESVRDGKNERERESEGKTISISPNAPKHTTVLKDCDQIANEKKNNLNQ